MLKTLLGNQCADMLLLFHFTVARSMCLTRGSVAQRERERTNSFALREILKNNENFIHSLERKRVHGS